MNLKSRLSERIGIHDIHEIVILTQANDERKQELYNLLFDEDKTIAYQAAWVFTHFNTSDNRWLFTRQDELIDEVLVCRHPGLRRLLLSLIYRQPLACPPRTDFLDFCMERMISKEELPGVQTLCMKLAYELCRPIPELLQEFQVMLDIMDIYLLPASIKAVHRNVLKAIQHKKSMRKL